MCIAAFVEQYTRIEMIQHKRMISEVSSLNGGIYIWCIYSLSILYIRFSVCQNLYHYFPKDKGDT